MKRNAGRLALACGAVVMLTAAARGGWVVTTIDDVPEHLVAGRPVDVTFTIRQHGVEALNDRRPTLLLREGRTTTKFAATRTKQNGQYTAHVTPTAAGDAVITVDPDFGNQKHSMLPLRTYAAGTAAPAALAAADRGKQLFVAKGCATCHTHAATPAPAESFLGDVGPNLTGKRFAVNYLKDFLADPSIKPPTDPSKRMPKMNLKPAEIAALVAFINESKVATR